MKHNAKLRHTRPFALAIALLLGLVLLAACSSDSANHATDGDAAEENAAAEEATGTNTNAETGSGSAASADEASTEEATDEMGVREITDTTNRTVEIPAVPERIVYIGSSPGDLITLGIEPVGASLGVIATQVVYPELLEGIEDVGGTEQDLEKITALNPDLILFDGVVYDDKAEALSKIAPAVGFDSAAPMYERLRFLADVVARTEEAERWIAAYEAKAETVIARIGASPDDTATVLLQLGKQLYVMGNRGLAVTVFDVLKFQPAPKVQELIEQSERFIDISHEVLPEYAGDWIFLLSNSADETVEAVEGLESSDLWQTIPAVKDGQVYKLPSRWNFDDPVTRERLLDELPELMGK
ncbi:ABC transporter substrate-binding protein [Paenibacillus sp. IB182496]|uniref:ABC transporter substrate-binding protein n=1 Tax=Paenibacillus sabuli TaxID=2772509 RepID=A0A927BQX7_9BACL|nr:ABC transporter substrate-binding protein [Paenibacillus sabuli]MBD2843909.1 ABC transporter substrate-binding protein [Paenibacillus sabuli]